MTAVSVLRNNNNAMLWYADRGSDSKTNEYPKISSFIYTILMTGVISVHNNIAPKHPSRRHATKDQYKKPRYTKRTHNNINKKLSCLRDQVSHRKTHPDWKIGPNEKQHFWFERQKISKFTVDLHLGDFDIHIPIVTTYKQHLHCRVNWLFFYYQASENQSNIRPRK